MLRNSVRVRPAVADDLPAVLALYVEFRENGPGRTPRSVSPLQRAQAVLQYESVLADDGQRLLVAVAGDGAVVGMAWLRRATIGGDGVDQAVAEVSQLRVASGFRRRGAGHALLTAALQWADETGLDAIAVNVHPASRETHRFYARLGFAPVVVRRVVSTTSLRRRLGSERAPEAAARPRRSLRRGPAAARVLAARRRAT